MSAQHTPGPWKLGQHLGARTGVHVIHHASDRGQGVPIIEGAVSLADASLISAAPDLLAALRQLLARSDMEHWPLEQESARAAIDKAEGLS